jgi:hypothetical protein
MFTLDLTRDKLAILNGVETDEAIHALTSEGTFVTSSTHISVIHKAYHGVSKVAQSLRPAFCFNDFVLQQRAKGEVLKRVVIRRDFWAHEDFNNAELNESFGVQNFFFDNVAWSREIWKEFRSYVDKWFPVAEHTHLTYFEYLQLIRYFYFQREGLHTGGLLPRGVRLRPAFGVPILAKQMREPMRLYQRWLNEFASSLAIKKALVVRCGSGLLSCITRNMVPLVRSTDTNPIFVESLREDIKRIGYRFRHMRAEVADMFPPVDTNPMKYDLIVFSPDVPFLNVNDGWCDNRFAPTQRGVQGDIDLFFEKAGEHLSSHGVIVVVTTNIFSLAFPQTPNPVELEIKANRRWLLLDYFDTEMNGTFAQDIFSRDSQSDPTTTNVIYKERRLRAEVWVLHRVESLQTFGWLHGLPGCAPPSNVVGQWRGHSLKSDRLRGIRQRLSEMGGDWGSYRERLMHMLRQQSDQPEDEVAQAVRMALDPNYADELSQQAKLVVEQNMAKEREFHQAVWEKGELTGRSPREEFDTMSSQRSEPPFDSKPRKRRVKKLKVSEVSA